MNTFTKIMDRIAIVLEYTEGRVPYEKNIAYALGMSPTQYANAKVRNSIPYKHIAEFCKVYSITINHILYAQKSDLLAKRDEEIFTPPVFEVQKQEIRIKSKNISQTVNYPLLSDKLSYDKNHVSLPKSELEFEQYIESYFENDLDKTK